jgi:Ca2+-binding EF-hand superfamily protein
MSGPITAAERFAAVQFTASLSGLARPQRSGGGQLMNKLLIGAAAAAFAMSPASAQPAPPPPPGVAQGTTPLQVPMQHVPPIIRSPVQVRAARIERIMTRDQVVQHVQAMFSHLDSNHDGFITKNEIAALHVRMMGMHEAMSHQMSGPAMEMDHGPMRMDPGAMFDRLDTNHDGVISRQEFAAAHTRMEERRVVVMHGVDGKQAMNGMGGMGMRMHSMGADGPGGNMAGRLFSMADANHDGRVSLQEAEAAALAHFDRIDLNHDGRITPDERRQAHGMTPQRRPG